MKKILNWLFPKYEIRHLQYHIAGTNGMDRHGKFIESFNQSNFQIIDSYITYHNFDPYKNNPEYIHYIIIVKKK